MQRLTKRLPLLLLPLLLATTGCVTAEKDVTVLPPKPERRRLEPPESIRDYAEIIVYYDGLVREWELWGATVSSIIQVN